MYSRARTMGSGLPPPALHRRREPDPLQRPRQPLEEGREASQQVAQLTDTRAYTMITPNENRRNHIQRIAEQELENLEKLKEQYKVKPINLVPSRLGGSQSEAEVRQKQQLQLMQSTYHTSRREESIRIKKEAEEAEIQKMKAIQREKSSKLEEKKRLQENLRREAFREHHQYKTSELLSKLNTELPNKNACQIDSRDSVSSTWFRYRSYKDSLKEEENRKFQRMKEEQHQKSELLKFKQQQQEEQRIRAHQSEQRRVNNAFLDRLQGKSQPGGLEHFGGYWNMNSSNSWDL